MYGCQSVFLGSYKSRVYIVSPVTSSTSRLDENERKRMIMLRMAREMYYAAAAAAAAAASAASAASAIRTRILRCGMHACMLPHISLPFPFPPLSSWLKVLLLQYISLLSFLSLVRGTVRLWIFLSPLHSTVSVLWC